MPFSLKNIDNLLKKKEVNIKYSISSDLTFDNFATLSNATNKDVSFFHNLKYKNDLINTKSAACFIRESDRNLIPNDCLAIITDDPYKSFITALNLLNPKIKSNGTISNNSIIDKNTKIGKNVEIQDNVTIKNNVKINNNVIIFSNTVIDENEFIDDNASIGFNCSISNTYIGKNCTIQSGVIIGSTGFGFAISDDNFIETRHLGKVLIGDNVRIGSNSTIARGTLDDTIVGNNVRIDNLCHIAHNVKIGNNCILAGQCGIAGSTTLGDRVIAGGQVGISGHLKIGNNVQIAAKSGVIKDISDNGIVGGYPAMNIRDWHRNTINKKRKINNES